MAIATLRGTLSNGSTKTAELEYKNTYMVIYGSGWLSPTDKGGSHDAGYAFKEVASARHLINKREHPDENCLLLYCTTDTEFFDAIKNNHRIERLDIYCHGFAHGLNLGGFQGKRQIGKQIIDSKNVDWDSKVPNKGRDLRRIDIHEDLYFDYSDEANELDSLTPSSFTSSAEIYFWGCNIGGQLTPKGNHVLDNSVRDSSGNLLSPKGCFAQKFAEKLGKGSVYALVGKGVYGGSVFKRDAVGRNYYEDGELLPANISANKKDINTKDLNAIDYMKKFPLP